MQANFCPFLQQKKCTEEGESSIYLGIKVYSSRFLPCILNSNETQNRNKRTFSVTSKCNIYFGFSKLLLILKFLVQLAEGQKFQNNFSCSVSYHNINNPG